MDFDKKLAELVREFNSFVSEVRVHTMTGSFKLKAKAETYGVHDFFLELNTTALEDEALTVVYEFAKKYKGKVGITPIKHNDCLCIRINSCQFK